MTNDSDKRERSKFEGRLCWKWVGGRLRTNQQTTRKERQNGIKITKRMNEEIEMTGRQIDRQLDRQEGTERGGKRERAKKKSRAREKERKRERKKERKRERERERERKRKKERKKRESSL